MAGEKRAPERLKIDHDSAVPLHAQVERLFRRLVEKKEYKNGKFLPKEEELAKQLGISRNTVRQAVQRLVHEGVLVRKKGVGTKVADNRLSTSLNAWGSFTHEMERKGTAFYNIEMSVTWVKADDDVAARFSISKGDRVLKLERLRGLNDDRVVLFISYFHPRVGLTAEHDFSQPLYELLEEKCSTVAVYSIEEITAVPASIDLAKRLKIDVDAPILVRKRLVCDPGRRPIEYNLCYYRADRFVYTVEIRRESY
ncbi:MAG: UTRA domain-containing protein [bacterium]|nr:UTRA domain-containing protein [bacterium]